MISFLSAEINHHKTRKAALSNSTNNYHVSKFERYNNNSNSNNDRKNNQGGSGGSKNIKMSMENSLKEDFMIVMNLDNNSLLIKRKCVIQ